MRHTCSSCSGLDGALVGMLACQARLSPAGMCGVERADAHEAHVQKVYSAEVGASQSTVPAL